MIIIMNEIYNINQAFYTILPVTSLQSTLVPSIQKGRHHCVTPDSPDSIPGNVGYGI